MWKPPILKLVAPRAYAGAAIESKGTDATAPTAEMITNGQYCRCLHTTLF